MSISGPICRTKAPGNKTVNGHTNGHATDSNSHSPYLVHRIRDAVVQDANDSEGTGVWANLQAVSSHVPAPSLTASHYMRIASADVHQRAAIRDSIGTVSPQPFEQAGPRRAEYLEQLRQAVYLATLVCFVQGLAVLERDNAREGWGIDVLRVLEIWRAGCIIKSDYVSDLLEGSYKSLPLSRNGTAGQESAEVDARNHPLCRPAIAADVKRNWPALKAIVLEAVRADAHVPCLGATLDYLKYSGNTDLPTCFTEAQLDSFGAHGFDLRSEPVRHLQKGVYAAVWCYVRRDADDDRCLPRRVVRLTCCEMSAMTNSLSFEVCV